MRMILSGEDWGRFEKCLHRLVGFDFCGLHQEVGEYLINSTKERFRQGVDPSGTAWPASIRAKESGGKTMMDSRRLYNSLTYQADMEKVVVGTNVKYAKTHQPDDASATETVIKAKKAKALKFRIGGRWATKKEVHVPARRFLGINDDDAGEIRQIGLDQIKECTE